jgi:hypothetical protein
MDPTKRIFKLAMILESLRLKCHLLNWMQRCVSLLDNMPFIHPKVLRMTMMILHAQKLD